MSAWSHLPNVTHIDRVIASVNKYPEIWSAAHNATRDAAWGAVRHATLNAAYDAACNAAWNAAYDAACNAAWNAARDAGRDAGRSAPWHSARDAILALILALIAYDDCDQYLSMSSEQLRAWALMTEHPAAVLLLPMVVVREQIEQAAT